MTRNIQKFFWIYLTDNFVIRESGALCTPTPKREANFVPITFENCESVKDFREAARVDDYRAKLAKGELGFFAQVDGRMTGSIWATINLSSHRKIVRGYMPLLPKQALVHDIVTGSQFRGMGIGPFMVGRIASFLLSGGVPETIIDVSVKNQSSLRMMNKAGLTPVERVLYISTFGSLLVHSVLKRYQSQRPVATLIPR
jgi:hypothetical protein